MKQFTSHKTKYKQMKKICQNATAHATIVLVRHERDIEISSKVSLEAPSGISPGVPTGILFLRISPRVL